MKRKPLILAIQYPRFGPYHIARINTAFHELKKYGIKVIGIETASLDDTYGWKQETGSTDFERYVALHGKIYEKVSSFEIVLAIKSVLDKVKPDAMAICGYSSSDALSALLWSKMHRAKTILMFASKYDDMPRTKIKELIKRRIISYYNAAICSGSPQRLYLKKLGMESNRIFNGAGVIDNNYFWQIAQAARQNPSKYSKMPGLDSSVSFFLASARFIECKNIDGLLRAYSLYLSRMKNNKVYPPWRLVIIGDGPCRSAINQIILNERITGVILPGFLQIDQLPIYYGLASTFILPSHKDTWGLVVNEAMAAGLPILVSKNCGCAADLVRQGENGFTFDSNDVGIIAELMEKMSSNKVDLPSMRIASTTRIKEWDLIKFAEGLHDALRI